MNVTQIVPILKKHDLITVIADVILSIQDRELITSFKRIIVTILLMVMVIKIVMRPWLII